MTSFLRRLTEAAHAMTVGPADDPETVVGPVIDAEARRRIERYIEIAAERRPPGRRGRPGTLGRAGKLRRTPHRRGRPSGGAVAQEEIFGPVLAVLRAKDLDEALRIANGTEYALTGGLYSRSPANIGTRSPGVPASATSTSTVPSRATRRSPTIRGVQAFRHRDQGGRKRIICWNSCSLVL